MPASPRPSVLRHLDALIPLAGALALVLTAAMSVSRERLWMDEWLAWYLLSDPTLEHLLAANADVVNAAPPAYFVLGWLWAGAFGTDPFALRLFTSLGFGCGLLALWWALRAAHGRWAGAAGSLVAVASCAALQHHNVEVRFYGLYFAEIAAGTAIVVALARRYRSPAWLLGASALVHAALCLTNYFGFVYGGALLVAQALALRASPRRALVATGSILLGWTAFLPWLGAFRTHVGLGSDGYWAPHPYLPDLFEAFGLQRWMGFTLLVLVGAGVAVEALRARTAGVRQVQDAALEPGPEVARAREALRWIALAFALVIPATWIVSQRGTSLFLHRYLFPTLIAYAVLWAELARRPLELARSIPEGTLARRAADLVPRALLVGLCATHVLVTLGEYRNRPQLAASVDGLAAPSHVPIVVEHAHDYALLANESAFPESYVFLLDEAFVRSPASARSGLTNHRIVEALARHYASVRTADAAAFLDDTPRFVVVDSPRHNWFDERVRGDPRFAVEPVEGAPGRFLVTRTVPSLSADG